MTTDPSPPPPPARALNLDVYREGDRFVKRRNYTKRYTWRIWRRIRTSKAMREKHCYDLMASLGVPIPPDIHAAEQRNALGLLIADEISLPFLDGAIDLRRIVLQPDYRYLAADPAWRRAVLHEIAHWVRHMHNHHFYPVNLHFRNILVQTDHPLLPPPLYFIDCVAGAFVHGRVSQARLQIKDLAYIYRDSRPHCTLREQLRFLHHYLGRRKLTPDDRTLILAIIRFTLDKWGTHTSTLEQ